jgi:hypothetical protein
MIAIFKTTVNHPGEAIRLKPVLDRLNIEWNFDLNDCDRILRVIADQPSAIERVILVLKQSGFICEELPD